MKTLTALLVLAALTVSVHAQEQFLSQPKIVVLPKSVNGVDALTLMKSNDTVITAAAAIRKVLVDRKLEVGDLEQLASNADFNRSMMAGLNSDMNAVIASAADADVYFEFTYEVIQGRGIKAKVNFNVKEASTGKVLGSGIGNSDYTITSDFGSLCAIAINNEINSIMEQIRSYWVDIPKYGYRSCLRLHLRIPKSMLNYQQVNTSMRWSRIGLRQIVSRTDRHPKPTRQSSIIPSMLIMSSMINRQDSHAN